LDTKYHVVVDSLRCKIVAYVRKKVKKEYTTKSLYIVTFIYIYSLAKDVMYNYMILYH